MKGLFLCVVFAIIVGSQTATAKNRLESRFLVNKLNKEISDQKAIEYLKKCGYIQEDEDANPDLVIVALKRMQGMANVNIPDCQSWSYHGENGPQFWNQHNKECDGRYQSPIAIARDRLNSAQPSPENYLNLAAYHGNQHNWIISNNGHTVIVEPGGTDIIVDGYNLDGFYKLSQFHFHWGGINTQGSEHIFDGKPSAMEAHFVHYSVKYQSMAEAMKHRNGLLVLGVLYDITDNDNDGLWPVVEALKTIQYKDKKTTIPTLNLHSLLPSNTFHYYTYHGSLTTPPCSEVVYWLVFHEISFMSNQQIDEFRKLTTVPQSESLVASDITNADNTQVKMVDNFRPLQSLNGRKVISSMQKTTSIAEDRRY